MTWYSFLKVKFKTFEIFLNTAAAAANILKHNPDLVKNFQFRIQYLIEPKGPIKKFTCMVIENFQILPLFAQIYSDVWSSHGQIGSRVVKTQIAHLEKLKHVNFTRDLTKQVQKRLVVKFIYCEKARKFEKKIHLGLKQLSKRHNLEKYFFQILSSSHRILTLHTCRKKPERIFGL